jgi:hypothetical protein
MKSLDIIFQWLIATFVKIKRKAKFSSCKVRLLQFRIIESIHNNCMPDGSSSCYGSCDGKMFGVVRVLISLRAGQARGQCFSSSFIPLLQQTAQYFLPSDLVSEFDAVCI